MNSNPLPRKSARFLTPLLARLLSLMLLLATGCVPPGGPPPLDPAVRNALGRIAIVSARFEPDLTLAGFARGRGHGAAMGAGRAVGGYFQILGQGSCSGSMCGAVYLLALMATPVVAAGGAVAGTVIAEPAGKVRPAMATASAAIAELHLQQALADRVEALAPEIAGRTLPPVDPEGPLFPEEMPAYGGFADSGIDTVMETSVLEIGTQGQGIDGPVSLFLRARLRLVRPADGAVLYQREYFFRSKGRKFLEWAGNGGEPLCQELRAGIDDLARQMIHGTLVASKVSGPAGREGTLPAHPGAMARGLGEP